MNNDIKTQSSRGGKRLNAGRKTGTGKFGEPTEVVRVPTSQKPIIVDFLAAYQHKQQLEEAIDISSLMLPALNHKTLNIPLFASKVPAGFPSPADDHVEKRLDPNEFLIDQADATFFVTIQGESMIDVGLMPGDKAVVDRSKIPSIGDIVLAVVDGDFTIKVLNRGKDGSPRLLPANASGKYQPIEIKENMTFEVWGVVTGSFRRFK
ncbi:MAG: DNA polymerase V [Methylophilaceae bacterium]|jgi:DNA polymerase V|tara:strand:- start:1512 stop:2132 length:621 start_codon:yes stop_codon:yes gene_type:complete